MNAPEIPESDISEWLAVLKPYQRTTISSFLESRLPEAAAELWLSSTGSQQIIPFGGSRDSKPFWEQFKVEFHKFVCDDSAYVEEKRALSDEASVLKPVLISGISAAIGATIGYSATLLAPAVAVLLYTVGKMGVNAYCNMG